VELASLSYILKYRPGQQNDSPDSFSRAFCSSTHPECALNELHVGLCHTGFTRLLHFVGSKNLPYSTTDVRRIVSNCKICAEVKLRFYRPQERSLINAMRPMERLNVAFKDFFSQIVTIITCSLWLTNTHVFLLYSHAGKWLRQLLSNVSIDSLLCVGRQGSFILITALLLYGRNLRRIYSNEELLQAHPVFITSLEMVRRRKLLERFGRPLKWPWNP